MVEVAAGGSSHWGWRPVPTVCVQQAEYARERLRLHDGDRRSQPLSRNTGAGRAGWQWRAGAGASGRGCAGRLEGAAAAEEKEEEEEEAAAEEEKQ